MYLKYTIGGIATIANKHIYKYGFIYFSPFPVV